MEEDLDQDFRDIWEENKYLRELNKKLDDQNTTMLRLIHLNDQKTALMEASPELAEAMSKIDGQS